MSRNSRNVTDLYGLCCIRCAESLDLRLLGGLRAWRGLKGAWNCYSAWRTSGDSGIAGPGRGTGEFDWGLLYIGSDPLIVPHVCIRDAKAIRCACAEGTPAHAAVAGDWPGL